MRATLTRRAAVLADSPPYRCRSLFGLAFVLTGIALWAVVFAFPPGVGAQPAPKALKRLLQQYRLDPQDVGYHLFRLTDGRVVDTYDADTPRIPASTTKLITARAALEILGGDYRFQTRLLVSGEVHESALHGDLYLVGGGDPTLSTNDLQGFVDALKTAGITQVSGRFAFDESFLTTTQEINPKQPIAAAYNPSVSALSLNYNRVQLRWKGRPGTKNFQTRLRSPADGIFLPVAGVSTGLIPIGRHSQDLFILDGGSTDRWLLSRQLPARGFKELPVKRAPGKVAASLFRTYCVQRGITLPQPQAAPVPTNARLLHTHYSKPLPEILSGMLFHSNNLSAELIGLVTSRTLRDLPLSIIESAALLTDWYQRRLPHADWTGFVSMNHSGLSSMSRHSPRHLTAILYTGATPTSEQTGHGGPNATLPLLDLLPHPEWENEWAELGEKVRAKSGTMSYADGLTGILTTRKGHQLGFALLVTDFARRAAFDTARHAEKVQTSPEAEAWTERAKAFEQALLSHWRRSY